MDDIGLHFALVGNSINISRGIRIEVAPDHLFRAATDAEIDRIRPRLIQIESELDTVQQFEIGPDGKSTDRSKWRYFVIEYHKTSENGWPRFHEIESTSRISRFPLKVRLHFSPASGGGHLVYGTNYSVTARQFGSSQLSADDLLDIGRLGKLRAGLDDKFRYINDAISDFSILSNIPSWFNIYALGVFAVLEAIITHDPNGGYDSLTHQVVAKMELLGKRLETPLHYGVFGENAKPSTIWKKLYAYRSAIAHGRRPDFKGQLSTLVDAHKVTTFLETAVVEILRFALREPELLFDLRDC